MHHVDADSRERLVGTLCYQLQKKNYSHQVVGTLSLASGSADHETFISRVELNASSILEPLPYSTVLYEEAVSLLRLPFIYFSF